jgi:hypothetical protein
MGRKLVTAGVVTVLLIGGTIANASITPLGEPFEGASWGQRFVGDTGSYDFLGVSMISGGPLESAAFRNFSLASWTTPTTVGNVPGASASGPVASNMQFDLVFAGNSYTPLDFQFEAYNGTAMVDSAIAHWNGGWSFTPISRQIGRENFPQTTVATPEPTTIIIWSLLGALAVTTGWRRREAA